MGGHVLRMPENRLPRQIMYGELVQGQRRVGGPRKRYKDRLKQSLRMCDISPEFFETEAADRQNWRSACSRAASAFNSKYNSAADERRARRHRVPDPNGTCRCEVCGRVCLTRIGLLSHRRTH